ncbi:DndE family protein [Halomonas rhizosphaerae]|uniref:DndE family protein n=1 Tax=Halomonas rhizosphaerae TaxID=3043296 RepID=A0ABT6V3Z9_9GAMM|nr:DndE family protein [Halomonas rhizosphaerae]MDI5892941.1 DndE family protein [Halomonas rhizosphaerae]
MLPNRIAITATSEEKLKREQARTGKQPNIAAREAFYKALESGFVVKDTNKFTQGTMSMDKKTWLGETEKITEAIIDQLYFGLSLEEKARAWALTVERGL